MTHQALERLHSRIEGIVGHGLPTHQEEEQDPDDAKARYEEAVASLRELTRDPKQFRLLAYENAEYGFRRNTFGLRPWALAIAVAVLMVSVIVFLIEAGDMWGRALRWGTSSFVSLVALAFWGLTVRGEWVKLAAENYVDRLFEAVESLRQGS